MKKAAEGHVRPFFQGWGGERRNDRMTSGVEALNHQKGDQLTGSPSVGSDRRIKLKLMARRKSGKGY